MATGPSKTQATIESLSAHPAIFLGPAGELRYDQGKTPALPGELLSTYADAQNLGHGVIAAQGQNGIPIIVQPIFEKPVINFSALASVTPIAPRIVFFQPEDKESFVERPIDYWFASLEKFGYHFTRPRNLGSFQFDLLNFQPDVVCFSVKNGTWGDIRDAYLETKKMAPSAITILGGMGAVPEAARYFDVVVMGEGDVRLPILLRTLQQPSVMDQFNSRIEPILTSESIADIFGYSIGRFAGGARDASMQEIAVDWGRDIYLRSADGVVIPPTINGFGRQSRPIPINSTELDILAGQKLGPGYVSTRRSIYSQRGCRGTNRCFYCSIAADPGRQMSVENVIALMIDAREGGASGFGFVDDNFIQNTQWTHELLDRIEAEGLNRQMAIDVQFRADTKHLDIVERLLTLGIRIMVGVETLDPARAERMGKVSKGCGTQYVENVGRFFDFIGEFYGRHPHAPQPAVSAFMINLSPGEDVVVAAQELVLELKMMQTLYYRYGFAPLFTDTSTLYPVLGDKLVETQSGLPHGQLLEIVRPKVPGRILHNGVIFKWHAFDGKAEGDMIRSRGISDPSHYAAKDNEVLYSRLLSNYVVRNVEPEKYLQRYYDVVRLLELIAGEQPSMPVSAAWNELVPVDMIERLSAEREHALKAVLTEFHDLIGDGNLIDSASDYLGGHLENNYLRMIERYDHLLDFARRVVESGKFSGETNTVAVLGEIEKLRESFAYSSPSETWAIKVAPLLVRIFGSVGEADRQYEHDQQVAAKAAAKEVRKQHAITATTDIVSSSIAGAATFLFAKNVVDLVLEKPRSQGEALVYGCDILGTAVLTDNLADVGVRKYIWKELAEGLPAATFSVGRLFAGIGTSQLIYKSVNPVVEKTGMPSVPAEVASLVGTGMIYGGARKTAEILLTPKTFSMVGELVSGLALIFLGADFLFGAADVAVDKTSSDYSASAREEWYRVAQGNNSTMMNLANTFVPKSYTKLTAWFSDSNYYWMKRCEAHLSHGGAHCY